MRVGDRIVTTAPTLEVFVPDDGGRLPEEEMFGMAPGGRQYLRTAVFELVVENERGVQSLPDRVRVNVYRSGTEEAIEFEISVKPGQESVTIRSSGQERPVPAPTPAEEWARKQHEERGLAFEEWARGEEDRLYRERVEAERLERERLGLTGEEWAAREQKRLGISAEEWKRLEEERALDEVRARERASMTGEEWAAREQKRLGLSPEAWRAMEAQRLYDAMLAAQQEQQPEK